MRLRELPLEILLMLKLKNGGKNNNIIELLDYYEISDSWVLILERPRVCQDLFDHGKQEIELEAMKKERVRQEEEVVMVREKLEEQEFMVNLVQHSEAIQQMTLKQKKLIGSGRVKNRNSGLVT